MICSEDDGNGRRAFLWTNGNAKLLGTLGGETSEAFAINSSSQITGGADTGESVTHAFLFDQGIMTDLGDFFGAGGIGYDVGEVEDLRANSSGSRLKENDRPTAINMLDIFCGVLGGQNPPACQELYSTPFLAYNTSMTPKLTPELDQALQSNGMPLEVVGADAKHYVIITLEQFHQMQQVLAYDDSELSDDEKIAAATLVVEDGPEMADYDNYDVNPSRQ